MKRESNIVRELFEARNRYLRNTDGDQVCDGFFAIYIIFLKNKIPNIQILKLLDYALPVAGYCADNADC
jgi:hypothetical protein